jgi:hypothetical protein
VKATAARPAHTDAAPLVVDVTSGEGVARSPASRVVPVVSPPVVGVAVGAAGVVVVGVANAPVGVTAEAGGAAARPGAVAPAHFRRRVAVGSEAASEGSSHAFPSVLRKQLNVVPAGGLE